MTTQARPRPRPSRLWSIFEVESSLQTEIAGDVFDRNPLGNRGGRDRLLCCLYVGFTAVVLVADLDIAGDAEELGSYLLLLAPWVLIPLLAVALLIDLSVGMAREIRSQG